MFTLALDSLGTSCGFLLVDSKRFVFIGSSQANVCCRESSKQLSTRTPLVPTPGCARDRDIRLPRPGKPFVPRVQENSSARRLRHKHQGRLPAIWTMRKKKEKNDAQTHNTFLAMNDYIQRLTAPSPRLGQLRPVAFSGGTLVQPLQPAIHLLVESPVGMNRHPHLLPHAKGDRGGITKRLTAISLICPPTITICGLGNRIVVKHNPGWGIFTTNGDD